MYIDKGSCDLSIPLKYLNVNTSVKHRNESTFRNTDEVLFKIYLTCLNFCFPVCFSKRSISEGTEKAPSQRGHDVNMTSY